MAGGITTATENSFTGTCDLGILVIVDKLRIQPNKNVLIDSQRWAQTHQKSNLPFRNTKKTFYTN